MQPRQRRSLATTKGKGQASEDNPISDCNGATSGWRQTPPLFPETESKEELQEPKMFRPPRSNRGGLSLPRELPRMQKQPSSYDLREEGQQLHNEHGSPKRLRCDEEIDTIPDSPDPCERGEDGGCDLDLGEHGTKRKRSDIVPSDDHKKFDDALTSDRQFGAYLQSRRAQLGPGPVDYWDDSDTIWTHGIGEDYNSEIDITRSDDDQSSGSTSDSSYSDSSEGSDF